MAELVSITLTQWVKSPTGPSMTWRKIAKLKDTISRTKDIERSQETNAMVASNMTRRSILAVLSVAWVRVSAE